MHRHAALAGSLLRSLLCPLLLLAVCAAPAGAGGWATVALDHLPADVRAGQTHHLGFTVLQHGISPMTGAAPVIRAWSPAGQALTFAAQPDGAPGHYVAAVAFSAAGTWTWEIVPGPFAPQKLAPLTVLAAEAPRPEVAVAAPLGLLGSQGLQAAPAALQVLRLALALGTVLAGASLALHLRDDRRRRPAAA